MGEKIKGMNKSFIKIKCPDCGTETITYSRGSIEVKCPVCNTVLARPTGGKYSVNGQVIGEFQ